MKFVLLIHSTPRPWGHPTSDHVAEHRALPREQRDQLNAEFEAVMAEMQANGELIGGEALADPAAATLFRWQAGERIASSGPYTETEERLAGFFLIDVASRARAEQIAASFSGPGETVELRPAMWPGGDDR